MKEFLATFTGPMGSSFQQVILADEIEAAEYCASHMYSSAYFYWYVELIPNYAGPENFDPDDNLPPWAKP